MPDSSRKRSIVGAVGKDGKWHSKRFMKAKLGTVGIVGCDFDVWKAKIHLRWWDCRIDSPKYVFDDFWHITVLVSK